MAQRFITVDEKKLPANLRYVDGFHEKNMPRRVAFYVDGVYMTRGDWTEVEHAVTSRRPVSLKGGQLPSSSMFLETTSTQWISAGVDRRSVLSSFDAGSKKLPEKRT